jgi:hypothetical protein
VAITRNAQHCLLCDEVIESTGLHDFQTCTGRHVSVDGGLAYSRVNFAPDVVPGVDFVPLVVEDATPPVDEPLQPMDPATLAELTGE